MCVQSEFSKYVCMYAINPSRGIVDDWHWLKTKLSMLMISASVEARKGGAVVVNPNDLPPDDEARETFSCRLLFVVYMCIQIYIYI